MAEWLNILFIIIQAVLLFFNIAVGLFNATLWIITKGLTHELEENGDLKEFINELKRLRKEVTNND